MNKEINKETLEKLQEIADCKNVDLNRLIKAFHYLKEHTDKSMKDIYIIDKLEIQTNLIIFGVKKEYEGEE